MLLGGSCRFGNARNIRDISGGCVRDLVFTPLPCDLAATVTESRTQQKIRENRKAQHSKEACKPRKMRIADPRQANVIPGRRQQSNHGRATRAVPSAEK